MNRFPVSSSNLRSVGYDTQTIILEVEFNSGWVYQYLGVPYALHVGLMGASSKGSYLDTYIKKGGFKAVRVK
ncbi:KTSC domain-containing protein [Serratia quinivorans]|uniref:KTSC domain-containing protein n=1 Tax=Serratia quinivorans TaxID=137545 RepID=UPI002E793FB7|nr:KTSC domain-containing protein [Serratia quinivorans]